MRQLRMLAACECSGRVRDAFAARGWDAWSCDLLPPESPPHARLPGNRDPGGTARHYQGDVRDLLEDHCDADWDLVIAFPPCTDLSLAGARWWKAKQADGRQQAAAEFFMTFTQLPAVRHVAIENPLGIMSRLYRRPDQFTEPFWFGDPYHKATGLWLKNLPPLVPDCAVLPTGRVATGGGSWRTDRAAERTAMNAYEDSEGRANRPRVRSRTFPGTARAMAQQWGSWIEKQQEAAA